jgi:GNAT superfamily N-acetyltransferase
MGRNPIMEDRMSVPADLAGTHTTSPALQHAPVRSLADRHRPRILAHLLALDLRDRYLRFGHAAGDGQIARYVDQIDFEQDEVFGIFNRRLEVVALAHLAYLGHDETAPQCAEFGVSVLSRARGRGWGARLFDCAVLHARNRHVDTLLIHSLVENRAMLHIARAAGAVVEHEGSDALARLKLPPENIGTHLEALFEHQMAEFDYGLKVHARRLDQWLGQLTGSPMPSLAPDSGAHKSGDAVTAIKPESPPPV